MERVISMTVRCVAPVALCVSGDRACRCVAVPKFLSGGVGRRSVGFGLDLATGAAAAGAGLGSPGPGFAGAAFGPVAQSGDLTVHELGERDGVDERREDVIGHRFAAFGKGLVEGVDEDGLDLRSGELPRAAWRIASLLPPGCSMKSTIPISGHYAVQMKTSIPHRKNPRKRMACTGVKVAAMRTKIAAWSICRRTPWAGVPGVRTWRT